MNKPLVLVVEDEASLVAIAKCCLASEMRFFRAAPGRGDARIYVFG
jgi:hypothetical protein